MNRFENLSDLSLATVMKRLSRYNGRRALALASKRFIGVYKRNCAWIERADHLATRMKQLWRARTCPSHLFHMEDAGQYIHHLMHQSTNIPQLLRFLADERNNVNLAKIDFSVLNFRTFEDTIADCTRVAVMRRTANILRFVKFEFDEDTVERIAFMVNNFVLAKRNIASGETTCTMFLNFPLYQALSCGVYFIFVRRKHAKNTSFVHVHSFQSFFSAMHFNNDYTLTNPKRWRGKTSQYRIIVSETDKIVDHTPQSLQID